MPQLAGTDPLDVFREHLNPAIQRTLTDVQATRMAEYRFVLGHITSGHTLQSATKTLQTEYALTQGSAYRRVQETFQIFGDFLKAEKTAKIVVYVEWLEKVLTECLDAASQTDDRQEKMEFLEMADKYMGRLIKLQELDKTTSLPKTRDKTKTTNIVFMVGPVPEQASEPEDVPTIFVD